MILRRTKIQLLVFVIITLLGVSFVGARYAKLDRLVFTNTYTVVAHFPESGGIFSGAEVTYRGVSIGQVGKLELTDQGVDVHLDISKKWDKIPADTLAVVGNRSAVGEQYVELQPQVATAPYLGDRSEIAESDTQVPIRTEKLLGDLASTIGSVDTSDLQTSVTELGTAFAGTAQDLQRIIETGNSFIKTANDNIDTTTALIRDSNVVLRSQVEATESIKSFARDFALFSGTLVDSDADLRTIIDTGSATATQLRTFLEENRVNLGELISELVTTGDIVVQHLPAIEQLLVIYPYAVEGGFTVVSKTPETGLYDAHFGLVMTSSPICTRGYESTKNRPPQDGSDVPFNTKAHCAEPPPVNSRGAQNAPRRAGAAYRAPTVASYDPDTGKLSWGDRVSRRLASPGTVAPQSLGEESWTWLFLQPLLAARS